MKSNTKKILTLGVISFSGYMLLFALNSYIARHVTDAVYGDFCLAVQVLNIFVFFVVWGTNLSTDRFLSKYYNKKNMKMVETYLSWNIKLILYTFAVGFAVSFLAFSIMMLLHFYGVKNINEYHLTVYMLWLFPFAGVFLLLYFYLANTGRIITSQVYSQLVFYIVQFMLFVLFVSFIDSMLKNTSLISVLFLSFIILGGLSIISLNRELLTVLPHSFKPIKKTRIHEEKGLWIQTTSKLAVIQIVSAFFFLIDLFMIEVITENEASVGHYGAALTITSIMFIIAYSMTNSLIPEVPTLLEKKKNKELEKRFHHVNLNIFYVCIFIAALIFYFEKPILLLFGPNYLEVAGVVKILTIAAIIASYSRMSCYLLVLGGHDLLGLKLSLTVIAFALILIVPLTLFYGLIGTAITMLSAYTLRVVLMTYFIRKKLNIRYLGFM